MAVPFAFSIHHFINTVGSDAGFASIIGLAILVLLYFSQARESANLREQANESAQRVAELEARLAQVARAQAAAAAPPGGVPAAARALANPVPAASVPAGAIPLAPAAPAGVGAPALAAATRVVPAGLMKAAPAGGNGGRVATPPAVPSPVAATALQPAPVTAAGAANGASATRPPAGGVPQPVPAGPRPALSARPPLLPPPEPRRSRAVRIVWAVLAIVAVGAAVAAVLVLTSSGSGTSSAANSGSRTTNALAPGGGKGNFSPGSITVAVLNGTTIPGGAHKVALRLASAGYRQGTIATASDQTRTATVVAFSPGHRFAATKVAALLRLGPASVQPVDPATLAVACPPPAPCAAQVVVTLGNDLASSQ